MNGKAGREEAKKDPPPRDQQIREGWATQDYLSVLSPHHPPADCFGAWRSESILIT